MILFVLLLALLFLVSGFAALIYQIVWQRALFTAFGVNIESITIVVAVFMFGLGVGALVGGKLSQRWPNRLPQLFVLCELAIGGFGLVSLPLIKMVSEVTLHGSLVVIAVTIYALLCIPTIFMGATLPILASYLHQVNRNVGRSVSTLYLCNTAGSAIACFVTAGYLFGALGQEGTIRVAATCNFVVAALLVIVCRYGFDVRADHEPDEAKLSPATPVRSPLRFGLVLALACACGYLALSQEILWFRAISYVTLDRPTDFAYVLGCVLFGIALGAGGSRWLCNQDPERTLGFVGILLAVSALVYGVSLPAFAEALVSFNPSATNNNTGREGAMGSLVIGFLIVATSAMLLGAVFPLLCHYAVRGGAVGQSISWIYFANIVGSTAGPLLTGFILLDIATLQTNAFLLTLLTAAVAALVLLISQKPALVRRLVLAFLCVGMAAFLVYHDAWFAHLLEKLQYKHRFRPEDEFKYVIQNRSGIIAIEDDPEYGDSIYGGGAYDGRFNLDPVTDGNGITRAYLLAALHPAARDVLVIGMSGGAWVRALTMNPDLKTITVVEINPGYALVMKNYPEIARALDDPRVRLHIDDGRRWLNRHPEARFDMMIMNTVYHWRGQATNLLSDEFLRICQARLKPGGFVYYHSTGSEDVFYTAAQVFKHIGAKGNFVIGSDTRLASPKETRRAQLLKFKVGPVPLFGDKIALKEVETRLAGHESKVADYLMKLPMVVDQLADFDPGDLGDHYRERKDLRHITDNNMATEFR
jgi:spermidine synthase/MFS family permease